MGLRSPSLAAKCLDSLSPLAYSPFVLCQRGPQCLYCCWEGGHADSEASACKAPHPSYSTPSTLHCEQGEIMYVLFTNAINTNQVLLKIIPPPLQEKHSIIFSDPEHYNKLCEDSMALFIKSTCPCRRSGFYSKDP